MLESDLAAAFPTTVAVCLSGVDLLLPTHPAEAELMTFASDLRRRHFAAGRDCARRALAQIGAPAGPLLRRGRAPAWPEGVTGSIAHTEGAAWCAAAYLGEVSALGIDVERVRPTPPDLRRRMAGQDERRAIAAAELRLGDAAAIVHWSAKEALFKCLSQAGAEAPDFPTIQVDLGGAPGPQGALTYCLAGDHRPAASVELCQGFWRLFGDLVFVGCAIVPAARSATA
ncbi:4'-phosphopantetheinyl transferase superfamily protein [Phenylobacterium sp.]|nr:4'-phosphopantetheinyl transferase superfamily protein [Phenylobacterium sp.]MCA6346665.1 4'-phosphopantetheinyl transferase superfamily protein [Phenylobacterium sp.]